MAEVALIGLGLAGSEFALKLASFGIEVDAFEKQDKFAYLICSNSLRGTSLKTAAGILKAELLALSSPLITTAYECAISKEGALTVDREVFSQKITAMINETPLINVIKKEITSFEELSSYKLIICAAGPLVDGKLAEEIKKLSGGFFHFWDAIAPVVWDYSLDKSKMFFANRHVPHAKDYLNIPLTEEEYFSLVEDLKSAETVELHDHDKNFFEGCLPIEEMAKRGDLTLKYGPLSPKGLVDPKTGKEPFAVVQLRQEDFEQKAWGLVGFQTRLKWGEQKRILRKLPGMEKAEFVRLGVIHRNSYINAPKVLDEKLQIKGTNIAILGQLSGIEGYIEAIATGMLASIFTANSIKKRFLHEEILPPQNTMLRGIYEWLTVPKKKFYPMNVSFALIKAKVKRKNREEFGKSSVNKIKEYAAYLKKLMPT